MHRVILLVLCVGGCTWIGLSYAGSLRQRAQRLKLARDGISQLVSAVRYTNQPLCAVSESIAARSGCAFWKDFAESLRNGRGAERAWSGALSAACTRGGSLSGLGGKDRAALLSLSGTLGKTDRYALAENARSVLEALDALIGDAEAAYAQKGRIYRALGLFCGLGLSILMW